MRAFRTAVFLLLIIPVFAFAETGDDSAGADTPAEDAVAAEGFSVSVDLRLGPNVSGLTPGLSAVIGVPLHFSSDTFSLAPLFGFQYMFDVWTDMHESFYIPLGLAVIYNPMLTGLELIYYPPVGGTAGNHLFTAAVISELELLQEEQFSMLIDLCFGPGFVLSAAETAFFIRLNTALTLRYML